jgi:hypothetical protein
VGSPTQPHIQWVLGTSSPGVQRPGRETGHSPTSEEVKKMRVPSIHLHGIVRHGESFTEPLPSTMSIEGLDVKLHALLTSPDVRKRSVSRSGRVTTSRPYECGVYWSRSRPRSPQRKSSWWYPLGKKQVWPHSGSGRCGVEKNLLPLPRIEPLPSSP